MKGSNIYLSKGGERTYDKIKEKRSVFWINAVCKAQDQSQDFRLKGCRRGNKLVFPPPPPLSSGIVGSHELVLRLVSPCYKS